MRAKVVTSNASEISRLEAASRQIDAAINMWLADFDVLAVHTVAMASYQLAGDLAAHKDSKFKRHRDAAIEKTMGHTAFRKISNKLKHGDRDPEGPVEVPNNEFNEGIIGGALVSFRVITDDLSELMGAFNIMMLSAHPERFFVAEDPDPDIEWGARGSARLLRSDISFRRSMVKGNLALIRQGLLAPNTNFRRTYHDQ